MTNTYEFSEQQNKELGGLVSLLKTLALCLYLSSALTMAMLPLRWVQSFDASTLTFMVFWLMVIGTIIVMWMAASIFATASKFKLVIDTEGNDIEHMMGGLETFSRIFRRGALALWFFSVYLAMILAYAVVGGGN